MCMWFPRLATDRALRQRPVKGTFVLSHSQDGADKIYCLNEAAWEQRLRPGMGMTDARAHCPDLISRPADIHGDQRFLAMLRRWATRWCPWVGFEGRDGLILDITGSAHLFGGEAALQERIVQSLARAGLIVRIGRAATRGAAWARARYGATVALEDMPTAALRIDAATVSSLDHVGLRTIGDLKALPRGPLARRYGRDLLLRLDQMFGAQPEQIGPEREPPHYGVRMTLPEPIGLEADVMAGLERLLVRLCAKLKEAQTGARLLRLTLRRVDGAAQDVDLRLARPLRDPSRILPLFQRGVAAVEAGFGIDQMRLDAVLAEPLPAEQITSVSTRPPGRLDDLLTRIGTRIGLENVQRFLPAQSHIPERSFLIAPAAYSEPESGWAVLRPRPLLVFAPEPIAATEKHPPARFRWRGMTLTAGRVTGPERIAPEWWLVDEAWQRGLRDYWHVETVPGRRLWMFHTPQNPAWFVQGEFP